jgi:predicted transcriptional regulator
MNLRALLYCTKAKGKNYYLRKLPNGRYCLSRDKGESLNGKIVAVHDYELEEISDMIQYTLEKAWHVYLTPNLEPGELKERSCLTSSMLDKYKPNYAIHIKNLNIFDKPKKISDFYKVEKAKAKGMEPARNLKRAPQNMCYAFDYLGNKYVLISVHPEWLCLILNGLKDVELRRKVLKEMRECLNRE